MDPDRWCMFFWKKMMRTTSASKALKHVGIHQQRLIYVGYLYTAKESGQHETRVLR